ncbi:DNA-processing protein DprA [Rickettsiales bacterium LUAb2]
MSKYLEQELVDIIILKNTENVSDLTFFKLLEYYGSPSKALEALPTIIKSGSNNKPFKLYPKESALKDIEECQKHNIEIITYNNLKYPTLLQEIEDKPPILFAKGNTEFLTKMSITIVGTRNPSLNGLKLATNFANDLSNLGLTVVSGMALGIDTVAHKASLKNGTIAFLGNGVNVIYPSANKNLYHDIINNGVVLSEFPINTKPINYNFPKRNRLLSGISHATIVVEASIKSGSLITARCAVEQNRDVFAVPANPNDINSQGTNKLLKEGAYLLENINDITDFIAKWKIDKRTLMEQQYNLENKLDLVNNMETDSIKNKILPLLSHTPIGVEILNRELNLHTKATAVAILELELSGKIIRYPGNKIALT